MDVQLGEIYRNQRAGFDLRVVSEPSFRGREGECPLLVQWRRERGARWMPLAPALTHQIAVAIVTEQLGVVEAPGAEPTRATSSAGGVG
jgi:hypothetical protein